jgi:hypothetical protein
MLFKDETALGWTMSEKGQIVDEVEPPQVVRTVDHTLWKSVPYRLPHKLVSVEDDMVKERVSLGLIERSWGPYRNCSFFVPKKNGKYRFIISCTQANAVTLEDAGLPPNVEEFAEYFSGFPIISLIDIFCSYEQISLGEESRDLLAFQTSRGLYRPTIMVHGAANSVSVFVRIARKIVDRWLGTVCDVFVDDVAIHGPSTTYSDEGVPALPGVRRFVLEHIINIDKVLADIERAGGTVSGDKSEWCASTLKLVGYICDEYGRSPDSAKVATIINWPACKIQKDVRAFLGVCPYYRVWIRNYPHIASPLFKLLQHDSLFQWSTSHDNAMDDLKSALTTAPALRTLDMSSSKGLIIVAVNASLDG